jgi:uncharacterized phage-associated protein
MVVGVRAIANELLDLAEAAALSIDPLQIQKFVYLAQGWTLGLTGEQLFREAIEAWEYGPVVPELYHSLKLFGASRIKGRLKDYDYAQRRVVTARAALEKTEGEIVRAVWKTYGTWSGPQLISLTHQSSSPWREARDTGEYNARISVEAMRVWFANEAERASLVNYP